MRLYRRSKQWDLMDTINRCYFDADHSRIRLALDRLADLESEVGPDARIAYAEGLLRKDFIGHGQQAHLCFVRALELDPHHAFAACNAAVYAPDETEFRKRSQTAIELSPDDAPQLSMEQSILNHGESYWKLLLARADDTRHGDCAALIDLALATASMPPEEEVKWRRQRAQQLRRLDIQAEGQRKSMGEDFPPPDRLALAEALTEIDRALALDEYDAELWNLKSAWCSLARRYEDSILCADRAIELRPEGYPRPYENKANSLWHLGRPAEARACAEAGIRQAEIGRCEDQIGGFKDLIQAIAASEDEPTLSSAQPLMAAVLRAAEVSAGQFLDHINASADELAVVVHRRLQTIQPGPGETMNYVPAMAETLNHLPPEICFVIILEIAKRDPDAYENCMRASLYIAAHAAPIMQRDALRLLTLTIFIPAISPGSESGTRTLYRRSILEVSAAARDEMSGLDKLMRQEISRISPEVAALVADQETVDEYGKARAKRNILSRLQGAPFISDSHNWRTQPPPRYRKHSSGRWFMRRRRQDSEEHDDR